MNHILQTAYCTTREAAEILGVSLRTAQLWAEQGLLEAWKTDGGHRRISRASVVRLIEGSVVRNMANRPETTPGVALDPLKVLIVEDDCLLIKLYKTVIASWNLPVDTITAGNGIDALIRIGRDAPDLMITDLRMPGMDGFQLIRNLATSSFREGLEFIVVTGLDESVIQERGGLPADIRVFPKPVPFTLLRDVFDKLLERRAAYAAEQKA